jgi:hypothetical protein
MCARLSDLSVLVALDCSVARHPQIQDSPTPSRRHRYHEIATSWMYPPMNISRLLRATQPRTQLLMAQTNKSPQCRLFLWPLLKIRRIPSGRSRTSSGKYPVMADRTLRDDVSPKMAVRSTGLTGQWRSCSTILANIRCVFCYTYAETC